MLKARDIMTKSAVTVKRNASVQKICDILTKHKVSGVPVIDEDDRIIGFVSERDIIHAVNKKDFLRTTADKLMTRKVFSVREDMAAEEVSRMFTEKPIRYLPVIKNDKVVGIISRKDIINRLLGQYY